MSILVRQVALRNYKSIAGCKVDLSELTVLVGSNGAGKSNFIDALRLVSDGLRSTLEYAIRQRGGIGEVRRRSTGHPTHFTISLHLSLGKKGNAFYAFEIGAEPAGAFRVQKEQARVRLGPGKSTLEDEASFMVEEGRVTSSSEHLSAPPKVEPDRLFLTTVSGIPEFRALYDALSTMGFYNIDPGDIREPQPHDAGELLARSGANLAAVIKRLKIENPAALDRIQQYMRRIVPNFEGVDHKSLGPRETLEFLQTVEGSKNPWRFYAAAMSDGTLRSLGVVTALFRAVAKNSEMPRLVAIEEPESTVHAGAAAVIMDALVEASSRQQVVATTHSPDLLDHDSIDASQVVAVKNVRGQTVLGRVDEASISAVKERLYTVGELLRTSQLEPSKTGIELKQPDFFMRPE